MTAKYLVTYNVGQALLGSLDDLPQAKASAAQMLIDHPEDGAHVTIIKMEPAAVLRRGEIPITCEDLLMPEPPKRGRPRKPKGQPAGEKVFDQDDKKAVMEALK